jgi:alanine racemase
VGRGDPVGYSATWRATAPTRIGTVAIGYANGYPRHASNRGAVAIGGHRAPLVGRVSMDLLTVDVSALPEPLLVPGAEVEICGDVITPAELAEAGGTNELALMIGLGKGCKRRHTGGR